MFFNEWTNGQSGLGVDVHWGKTVLFGQRVKVPQMALYLCLNTVYGVEWTNRQNYIQGGNCPFRFLDQK